MVLSKPALSIAERVDIVVALLALILTALHSAITGFFRSDRSPARYKHHVTHSLARFMLARLSTAQLQSLGPPFRQSYQKFCKKENIKPVTTTFPSGIEGFWMGDPNASYVFVYFHGGGYALDGNASHLEFCGSVQRDLHRAAKSIAWLFVAYSLAPEATYPTPICEGVEVIEYLIERRGRRPSDLILGGDSAGGAIALALLSRFSHPSPDIPPLKAEGKFKAIVIMAPWVSFDPNWPSCKGNESKDVIPFDVLTSWSTLYRGDKASNHYMEPVKAPASWWDGARVEDLLCTAGGDEILLDSISEWAKRYKSANPHTITYVVGKDEAHIAPILEPTFMDSTETLQGETIKAWLKARL